MANLVEITDFEGQFQIARDNFTKAIFDDYRDEKQFNLIYKLLGAELGQLFIDDLDANGVPVTARFTAIYEAFIVDDGSSVRESKGIKEMTIAYIYYYWCRDNNRNVGITGNTKNKGENSDVIETVDWIVRAYNKAIATYKEIQWYIGENSTDYPEYNGVPREYLSIY